MSENNQAFVQVGGPAEYARRDDGETARLLADWLTARNPAWRDVRALDLRRPVGAGMSNETILFQARWREDGVERARGLVARIAPGAYRLFRTPAFERQYRLLDLLHGEGLVRVPRMFGYEPDAARFGEPFFVMERLDGRVPVSFPPYNQAGFLFDAAPAQRRALWTAAVEEMCRIHRVPDAKVAFLANPELGPTGFDQLMAEWLASYDWATDGAGIPVLDAVAAWLRDHAPTERIDGLSWGDARIGNMMFADDFSLSGVMDWEQISLGGAMQDLGWWLFFDDAHSSGIGLPRLDGLGTREETIALWQEATGRTATDLLWYEVFAGFKLAVLVARKHQIEGGDTPGHNRANNLFTRLVADRLGWSRPADLLSDDLPSEKRHASR